MNLQEITPAHIEGLGENFVRNATRLVNPERDDRVAVAQDILVNISNLGDLAKQIGQKNESQVLKAVANVFGQCVKIAEGSNSTELQLLAPEIREQAEAFQPEMA